MLQVDLSINVCIHFQIHISIAYLSLYLFQFWLGIELDYPCGICDGAKEGKKYFKCQPNQGIFVLPSKVSKIISKDTIDLPSSGGSCSPSPNPPVSTLTNTRRRH